MTEDRSRYRCSFCGRHQDNVDRLIAGLRVFICNECVEMSAQGVSDRSHFGEDVACSFCGKIEPDVDWLVRGGAKPNTFICDECVALCQEIMREPPTRPTAKGRASKRGAFWRFRWPWQPPHLDKATRS